MTRIFELREKASKKLKECGISYPAHEVSMLLEYIMKREAVYFMLHMEDEVDPEVEEQLLSLVERRCEHYPLQYILGRAYFMDYAFSVNENVLIPRYDTEILGEFAYHLLKKWLKQRDDEIHVFDLCCGSGCIGISLKLYYREIKLTMSDISKEALQVAQKNLNTYEMDDVNLICGDLFEGFHERADMIVCNPPYIESDVIPKLMPEVSMYEPMLALDGGEDGLTFYRRIIKDLPNYLKDGGCILFEVGCKQAEAVSGMLREHGFLDIDVLQDHSDLDRVVIAHI